MMKAPSQRKWL